MFIAALLTAAKTWKQPKCPSTDEWIKKMWYIYTMEHYSSIKRNEIVSFAAIWMDLKISILINCQTEKDKYHYDVIYKWKPKEKKVIVAV